VSVETGILARPTFIVIGTMKGGTTALWQYLRRHPQVFMPEAKETDFFAERFDQGLDWYAEHFLGSDDAVIAYGEASPNYTRHPLFGGVPERIARHLPDVRLIYVVRDPIDRIQSHYLHRLRRGREWRPIEKALFADPDYLDTSRYAMQIDRYLEHVDRDRLLVITSDALRGDREATMRTVFRFIGVDDGWTSPVLGREFHKNAEKQAMKPIARRVRAVPGLRSIAHLAPMKLKRQMLGRIDPAEAAISNHLRGRIEDALRHDVASLRPYLGPTFDAWGIA